MSCVSLSHELCQFSRRELSDVCVANSIPTFVSAALAPACNDIELSSPLSEKVYLELCLKSDHVLGLQLGS